MTPDEFEETLAKLDSETERLRARVEETEERYSQSLVANTKLTAELGATIARADQAITAARSGTAVDYLIVGAGLLVGWAVGYYGQKVSRKLPLVGIAGITLAAVGAGMYKWSWKYRGAMIFGGGGMAVGSFYVFVQQGLPPHATAN